MIYWLIDSAVDPEFSNYYTAHLNRHCDWSKFVKSYEVKLYTNLKTMSNSENQILVIIH